MRPLLAYCASLGWYWRWLWRSRWNVDWQEKPKFSEETCPSATLVHHKIPHDQTRVWTRAAVVGSWWLTAWTTARPRLALSKGPNWVGIPPPSPEDGNKSVSEMLFDCGWFFPSCISKTILFYNIPLWDGIGDTKTLFHFLISRLFIDIIYDSIMNKWTMNVSWLISGAL
jgi:hypothetical protein